MAVEQWGKHLDKFRRMGIGGDGDQHLFRGSGQPILTPSPGATSACRCRKNGMAANPAVLKRGHKARQQRGIGKDFDPFAKHCLHGYPIILATLAISAMLITILNGKLIPSDIDR